MLKKISNRKGFLYLVASGIILLVLVYAIAISPTVEIIKDLRALESKNELIRTAPETIAATEMELASLNEIIGAGNTDGSGFQNTLLNRISNYCAKNDLLLREFPPVITWQKGDYGFITANLIIEASFIPLLKLLYDLETSDTPGKIISVSFNTNEDRKTKLTRLSMSVYIQTIKPDNHDSID